MSEILNFRKARAEKMGDGRLWTPLDALETIDEEIRSGKTNPKMLAIHYVEEDTDGNNHVLMAQAGMNHWEHLSILELAKFSIIKSWESDQ